MKQVYLKSLFLSLLMIVVGNVAIAAPGDEINSPDNVVSGKSYYIKGVYTSSKVEYTCYYAPTDAEGKFTDNAATDISGALPIKFTKVEGGWTLTTPNGFYVRPHTSNGQSYLVKEAVVLQLASGKTKEGEGIKIGPYVSGSDNWYIQCNMQSAKIGAYKNTQYDVTLIECGNAVSSAVTFADTEPSIEFPATSTYTQEATTAEGYTGTVTYEITANTAGATIDGSKVTVTQAGSVTVKATAEAVEGFLSSTATYTLTVNDTREDNGLEFAESSQEVTVGEVLNAPTLTNPNNLAVTYSSSDKNIATVDADGNVTGVAVGTAEITATFGGNGQYKSGSVSYNITVKKATVEGTLLYESVSGYKGTTDVSSELSVSYANLDYDKWESFSRVYAGKVMDGDEDGHLKFGSSNYVGKAVTGSIELTGSGKLTYKVRSYDSKNAGSLKVSVTGADIYGDTEVTGTAGWEEKTVNLTNANGEVVITFETLSDDKRIRVDDIMLVETETVDISSDANFTETAPSIELPSTSTYSQEVTTAEGYTGTVSYEITANTAGATIDGSTVTVTKAGSVTVKATAEAVEGFLSSTATYTLTVNDTREDNGLEFAESSQEVTVGEVLNAPTLTNPNNLAVTYSSSDEDIATVDTNGNVTGVAEGTTEITATFEGNDQYKAGSASYNVTVTVGEIADQLYTLLTSADNLTAGDKVIIVSGEYSKAMSKTQNQNNRGAVEVVIQNNEIHVSNTSEIQIFTLKGNVTDGWYFYTGSGYIYAAGSGSGKNYLRTETEKDENGNSKASISISDQDATVQFQGTNTNNLLKYNSNSDLYSCYSSGQKNVQIYRLVNEKDVTVNISSVGYATLYYGDRALRVPAGVTAKTYKVTNGKLEESKVYETGSVIPAGQAVVLKGAKGDYPFYYTEVTGESDSESMLKGSDVEETTTGGNYYYALQAKKKDGTGGPGFYWMNSTGAAFNNGAHKAYMALDEKFAEAQAVGGAKEFYLFDEATTGISGIDAASADRTEMYNLNGQRVDRGYKGVVIKNGKKIVRK